ncbi:MAG: hypothetical protein JJT75_02890 [Opitutales bacterium]|nr:hypothetical protein [Opitutales bacterium]MCH8540380.1 hypothetical protein [Opitutales bacterium]
MKLFFYFSVSWFVFLGLVAKGEVYFATPAEVEWAGERPDLEERLNWETDWLTLRFADEGAEAYYGFLVPEENFFLPRQLRQLRMAVRFSSAEAPREAELLVRRGEEEMQRYALYFPDETVGTEADFLRGQMFHYLRLAELPFTGQVWFAEQARQAEEALRAMPEEERGLVPDGVQSRPRWGRQNTEPLALFSGGRAIAENLALNETLWERGEEDLEATVDLADIRGITIEAIDWGPLMEGEKPALDGLASWVTADQHFVYFPNRAAVQLAHHGLTNESASFLDWNPLVSEVRERLDFYLAQMGLEAWREILLEEEDGPEIEMAVTGGDWHFLMGTDVALLVQSPAAETLFDRLQDHGETVRAGLAEEEQRQSEEEAAAWSETMGGLPVGVFRSGDRRVSAYFVLLDETTVMVANSPRQLRQLQAVREGELVALSEEEEYHYFRQEMSKSAEEVVFVMLTDDTIRRWCSPEWRIGGMRQIHALARMERKTAGWMDDPEASVEKDFLLGEVDRVNGMLRSPLYGNPLFLTPVGELGLEKVTETEQRFYQRWRGRYSRQWTMFFDPIGWQVLRQGEGFESQLAVIPLTATSEYRTLINFTRGGQLAEGTGGYRGDDFLNVSFAIDRESQGFRSFRGQVAAFVPDAADPMVRWVGDSLTVFVKDKPLVRVLAEQENPFRWFDDFETVFMLPVGARVESRDPVSLAIFLTSLRSLSESAAPGLLEWKTKTYEGKSYVQVASTGGMMFSLSIYYAATSKALLISLNESVIQEELRNLDREYHPERGVSGDQLKTYLSGPGIQFLTRMSLAERPNRERLGPWQDLPLLTEWQKKYPEEDALARYEKFFGRTLRCSLGGDYQWDEENRVMRSTAVGSLLDPVATPSAARVMEGDVRFGLTFEHDGVFINMNWQPRKPDEGAGEGIDLSEYISPIAEGVEWVYTENDPETGHARIEERIVSVEKTEETIEYAMLSERFSGEEESVEMIESVWRLGPEGLLSPWFDFDGWVLTYEPAMVFLPRSLSKDSVETHSFEVLSGEQDSDGDWVDEPSRGKVTRGFVFGGYETVQVPAGRFEDCLRIEKVIYDEFDKSVQLMTYWLARGIGVVKIEWTQSGVPGKSSSELQSYSFP